jgi:integrase
MRIRETFTVFARVLKSGKVVFYYQTYDEKGRRQYAKSTGKSKKTEAKEYCMRLFRDGLLIPEKKVPSFAEFSEGWWDFGTSPYLKWRQLHEPLAESTIAMNKGYYENHIKDYFAKFRLDEITPEVLEAWLLEMSVKKEMGNKKDENRKTLKPKTINSVYGTLRLMLGEAYRKKLIKTNPCHEVKELKEEEFEREIITLEEYFKLFPVKWSKVWDNELIYRANRIAATTGLRIGELRGLRGEHIYDDYIYICGQYTRYGYSKHTKTKNNRKVPISPELKKEFDILTKINGQGYVFSEDGGETPVSVDRIRRQLDQAFEDIGISHAEKIERNLSFHAWRHFFNTFLRVRNVADSKVQPVIGHMTKKMTDKYTHFDTRKFNEVRDVQTELLTAPQKETPKKTATPKKKRETKKAAVSVKTAKKSNVLAFKKPKKSAVA